LTSAQEEPATVKAKKQTNILNTYLLDNARSHDDISFLVSLVIIVGFAVGHFQQLF
jgi:uncharacterized membrane protein YciS (DUF1049 family)